jgi:hypothetical protein
MKSLSKKIIKVIPTALTYAQILAVWCATCAIFSILILALNTSVFSLFTEIVEIPFWNMFAIVGTVMSISVFVIYSSMDAEIGRIVEYD